MKAEPVTFSKPDRVSVPAPIVFCAVAYKRQVHRHARGRIRIRHRVVARATHQRVVAAIAFQRVVKCRTRQVLKIDQRVALGVAAHTDPQRKADVHTRRRAGIARRINAATAIQRVRAAKARNDVGPGIAGQGVVEGRSRNILEAGQGVGACADRVLRRRNKRQVHRHARRRVRIRHHVDARATDQRVVAAVAFQRVVKRRTDQTFDVLQHIARGLAGVTATSIETYVDTA